MKVYVTKNKVTLEDGYIVNRGEYKVTPLEFEFTEEYTNQLVKSHICKWRYSDRTSNNK